MSPEPIAATAEGADIGRPPEPAHEVAPSAPVDFELLREVEQFLYREARYADEHEYDAWEALWADEAIYWVPANGDDIDPTRQMSVIYDNRSRIALRIKQYHTGKRHSQIPPSALRRTISNVEILESDPEAPDDQLSVGANFLVYESRERGLVVWAGRYDYRLRRTADDFEICFKKVRIVGNDRPIHTLSFLI